MTASAIVFLIVLAASFGVLSVILLLRNKSLRQQISSSSVSEYPPADLAQSTLIEQLPIPVFRKDSQGHILYVNKAFEEMIGRSRHELQGKTDGLYNSFELASIDKAQDQKLLERGGDQIYEGKIENHRGEVRNIVFHKRAITDQEGRISEIIGLAFDITDRKQIEQQLLEQQKMFMSLVENLPDLIIRYDREYRRTYVNPAYFELTGTSAGQILGSNAGDIWTGDIAFADYQALIRKVFTGGEIENLVISQSDRHGKNHLFSISLVPETTSVGQITGVFAIGHDITRLKQTENQFRNLTENWPDEIATYDINLRRIFMNPAMEQTLSKHADRVGQLLGATPSESIPGVQNIIDYENKLKEVLTTGKVCDYEMLWQPNSQQCQYRQVKMLPEYDIAGKICGIFTVARDITQQKQAENEKQKKLEFFANLDRVNRTIQQSNDLKQTTNDTLKVILDIFSCDRAFLAYPLDPEVTTFTAPIEQTRPEYPGAKNREEPVFIDKNGRIMLQLLLASDHPLQFGTHSQYALPQFMEDVFAVKSMLSIAIYPKIGAPWHFSLNQCSAERIWTENEIRLFHEISNRLSDALTAALSYQDLQDSKHFIDSIFTHIPTMLYVKDAKTLAYVRVNQSAEEFMNASEAELIGKTDFDFFSAETATFHRQTDLEALEKKSLVYIPEEILYTPEGKKHYLQVKKMVMTDQQGNPDYLLILTDDVTKLKLSQETTRQFTQVITQSPYGIIFTDTEGHIEFANQKFYETEQLTPEELSHMTLKQLLDLDAEDLRLAAEVISEHGVWRQERRYRSKTGDNSWRHLQITAITDEDHPDNPITNFVIVSEDISQRKLLEEQLHHSQRMEAIGQLAGGVAHDFNNMLGVIVGRTDLALTKLSPEDPLFISLQEVSKAANRSADLTRQLLTFARKQDIAPKILELNKTVEGTLNMLRRLIGEDIHLVWIPSPKTWPIKIDPSQLDQILTNLCVNARDAMPEGGKIIIETGNVTLSEEDCCLNSDATPGNYAMLSICDNGSGINQEFISNIFDPFFTTKELGKGTGLGLSTVYGIVKQNKGFINVVSEPGHGTTFTIFLPRVENENLEPQSRTGVALPRGTETILVVEDDQTILATEASMLEMLGYRVFAAQTPAEAILLAEQYSGHIQLLISDVIMPDMNGRELVRLMTTHYPQLKTLYMSGYTGDVIAHHGVLEEGVNFLQKPFSLHSLATKVREVLDKS